MRPRIAVCGHWEGYRKSFPTREVSFGEQKSGLNQLCTRDLLTGKVCKAASEGNSKEETCNKAVATEVHKNFAFTTKVKEVINPQTILKVLESDFAECSAKTTPYSAEDRRLLNILENGIVKTTDGHYEMPLPLKSDKLSLLSTVN